jgi:hypothetical protein
MARSAAPEAIARDADVLVLGRQGYETAVKGKNGFVCIVERSWMSAFDFPEFWNPQLRGPICFNRPAARFRGGEQFLGAYAYLDVTPKGRNENRPAIRWATGYGPRICTARAASLKEMADIMRPAAPAPFISKLRFETN